MEQLRAALPPEIDLALTPDFNDQEFARLAADADILINARRRIDAAALAIAPRLRFVQLVGIGHDTIDVEAVRAAGITVAYNPGVNASGVAEHTVMLMMALVKRLPVIEQSTRAGKFATGEIIGLGLDDLAGATVGLIGLGDIGRRVAERLIPFGSRIAYYSRNRVDSELEQRLAVTWMPFSDLLAVSKIVSLHVPLTSDSYYLIDEAALAAMPTGSYLLNTARGGLVDEEALRRSIERGHLAGAGLDVLENETAGKNPFADLPQVIVTPHVSGNSLASKGAMIERCAANICRLLAGEPIRDVIPGLRSVPPPS
jgi:phosphoglycerate dehydrogenase-like enzyme